MQHSCSHHNAFCSMTWLTRMYLCTWQHQMTKIMQPSQFDLQPPTQETNGTMRTGKTTRCRTQRRNRLTSKRSKPQPPHTGGTFHRRLQPLYTEKHTVSCSGFLPNTSPCNIHAANYNAFCSTTYTSMQPLQCYLCPLVPEHRGGTDWPRNSKRSKPQPPHTGGTFHHCLQPLYTEKHKVSCSGFLPVTKPHATFMQPSQCILQRDVANPALQECIVMWCQVSRHRLTPPTLTVLWCDVKFHTTVSHHPLLSVLLCDVKSHTTASHHPSLIVLLCDVKSHTAVSHHPSLSVLLCDVMFHTTVWHHPSLSVLLCDVKSHTTVSHHPSLSVLLCDVKFHTTVSHYPSWSVLLCDVKSHTTVSHHPPMSVLLCDVKSHTTVSHHPSLSVLLRDVKSHTTTVSHHPPLSVLLCDVKSHTTASHHPSLSVLNFTPQSHTTLLWMYCYVMWSLIILFVTNSEDCCPTCSDYRCMGDLLSILAGVMSQLVVVVMLVTLWKLIMAVEDAPFSSMMSPFTCQFWREFPDGPLCLIAGEYIPL